MDTVKNKFKLAFEGSVTKSSYFFFDSNPKPSEDLAIIFGGFEKCAPDFEINRKSYPYYVVEIPTAGMCDLTIEDSCYQLSTNTIGAFAPEISHQYICDRNNPMEHIFIAFNGTKAQELMNKSGFEKGKAITLSKSADISYLAHKILKRAIEKTENSHDLCCSYLKALLLEQSIPVSFSTQKDKSASLMKYRLCRRYIDENFSDINLPSQVADKCRINVRYLSRLFKKYGKITPQEYIMRLKLNKASNILLNSSVPVKDVAEKVGFIDPYHFSRNFKKFHGLSPKTYRQTHISNIQIS